MSDDSNQSTTVPPLPESYLIPRAAIDRWVAIPQQEYVNAQLSRHDWDMLFESYDKMLHAQWAFQESMIAYTNGNHQAANEQLARSRALLIESQNAFRMMFASLMMSAGSAT